jgi:GntP family gluconate:H+ symporter
MLLILLLLASVGIIVFTTTKLDLHPFLALILAALFFGIFSGMDLQVLIDSIEEGFGNVAGGVGIIIIAGIIIGTFLERSGGATSIAEWVLKRVGRKRVPLAMSLVGYITAIPVFADSAFVMLAPLNQALTLRAKLSLATTVMALVLGLQTAHTMVPPTPGPIAAAGILGADLGLVLAIGVPVSFVVVLLGWFYAEKWASRVDLDPAEGLIETDLTPHPNAPGPAKSFAPIFIPLVLIVLRSVAQFPTQPFGEGWFASAIGFVGHPLVALLLGVVLALTLPQKLDRAMISSSGWVGKALYSGGVIILITGAGGAFGKVLQNSGIVDLISGAMVGGSLGLWLPFLISAALRTAQGSATVALITTASLLAPLVEPLGLATPEGKALMVLAIGAGAMVASHANDSMFWIVTQMSGMDVKTGYRLQTVLTTALGFSAAVLLWLVGLVLL